MEAEPRSPSTPETVNVLLRLPRELKVAAEALKPAHLNRPRRNGLPGQVSAVRLGSVNETLLSLIKEGLESMLGYVETALAKENAKYAALQEIIRFFLDNPTSRVAKDVNFEGPDGAHVRSYLSYMDAESGYDRIEAFGDLANAERRLMDLTTAKGAIQEALDARST